jgi:P27 family predicted phage terminase small subunit
MGKRGPAPTPAAIRMLEGTYREDRHGAAVRVREGVPAKPEWLGDISSTVWDERIDECLETPGLLSPMDGPALALYCDAWQQFHDAKAIIDKQGMVAISEKGAEYQHPAVGIKNKAGETIARLGAKFGFTPSDRSGLKPTVQTPDDELSMLMAQ